MATKRKPKPLTDAAAFTGDDPPPRRRPVGEPLPRFVAVPPGEHAAQYFAKWDHDGRVPAGSVLCRFVGTDFRTSGYAVECQPADGSAPLGPVGRVVPADRLDAYAVTVTVVERPGFRQLAVMSPRA